MDWQTDKKYLVIDKELFCRSHCGVEERHRSSTINNLRSNATTYLPMKIKNETKGF